MAGVIDAEPLGQLDYAEVVDATSLAVPEPLAGTLRLLAAVRFGKARLIDNVAAEVPAENPSAGATAAPAGRMDTTWGGPHRRHPPKGARHASPHDEVQDPPRHGARREPAQHGIQHLHPPPDGPGAP